MIGTKETKASDVDEAYRQLLANHENYIQTELRIAIGKILVEYADDDGLTPNDFLLLQQLATMYSSLIIESCKLGIPSLKARGK